MLNPIYQGVAIDMFMAGDSEKAKSVAYNWRWMPALDPVLILANPTKLNCLKNSPCHGSTWRSYRAWPEYRF